MSRSFLLASALTLWAVLGELVTVILLLAEIRAEGAIPGSVIAVLGGLGGISLILVCVYVLRGTYWVVKYQTDQSTHKAKLRAGASFDEDIPEAKTEAPLPSWSIF